MRNKVKIRDIIIGGEVLVFVGGPCVIEDEDSTLRTA